MKLRIICKLAIKERGRCNVVLGLMGVAVFATKTMKHQECKQKNYNTNAVPLAT